MIANASVAASNPERRNLTGVSYRGSASGSRPWVVSPSRSGRGWHPEGTASRPMKNRTARINGYPLSSSGKMRQPITWAGQCLVSDEPSSERFMLFLVSRFPPPTFSVL